MPIKYVTVKSPLKTKEASNSKYIKVINSTLIDKYKIAQAISDQCSITVADVVAVMQAYETNLIIQFGAGNNVEMFNVGTLKPCFKADFDSAGKVIKSSLRLSKIQLITNDIFIKEAKGYNYKYCGEIDYNKEDFIIRTERLYKFFEETKPYITSSEYCALNHCTASTGKRDLALLKNEGILDVETIGHIHLYRLVNKENQRILKESHTLSRRKSNMVEVYEDEYVEMFYNLIGGNFSSGDFNSDNADSYINENEKIEKACKIVMQNIADKIGADDIYDEKVIKRLDSKVFPVKDILRNKKINDNI